MQRQTDSADRVNADADEQQPLVLGDAASAVGEPRRAGWRSSGPRRRATGSVPACVPGWRRRRGGGLGGGSGSAALLLINSSSIRRRVMLHDLRRVGERGVKLVLICTRSRVVRALPRILAVARSTPFFTTASVWRRARCDFLGVFSNSVTSSARNLSLAKLVLQPLEDHRYVLFTATFPYSRNFLARRDCRIAEFPVRSRRIISYGEIWDDSTSRDKSSLRNPPGWCFWPRRRIRPALHNHLPGLQAYDKSASHGGTHAKPLMPACPTEVSRITAFGPTRKPGPISRSSSKRRPNLPAAPVP